MSVSGEKKLHEGSERERERKGLDSMALNLNEINLELALVSANQADAAAGSARIEVKKTLATRLWRLMHTGPLGIVDRGRQQMQRSADRLAIQFAPVSMRSTMLFAHLDSNPTGATKFASKSAPPIEEQRGDFQRQCYSRFFAGVGETTTAAYVTSRFSGVSEHVFARADNASEHILTLMGHRLHLGAGPIDWHQDPLSGRRAPRVHWSRIDPLDYAAVGDSKMTWEVNRHQWLVDLAQGYRFSGREAYAQAAMLEVEAWMQANPPGIGINWSSSLEVALRAIAWCWMLALLQDSHALTPQRYQRMLGWIRLHAGHVEKYLSRYFSPNTHLTGEALGLVYVGTLFPQLARAAHWRRLGARLLVRQLPRQVLADGVYFEQSTCYARYTAEIYLHFFILAQRSGIKVPHSAHTRLCRLLDYLLALRWPGGSLPQIGDADGGRLLPLTARDAMDCRDVFAVAAAWFSRADYARAADGLAPEVPWLLGAEGCEHFEALEASVSNSTGSDTASRMGSKLFPRGGSVVMSSGEQRDAHQLIFDVGPLGCPLSAGHGHADLLSVQCATFGQPRLGDPGTYCYTSDPLWRDYFRGTHAHNTVVIDGQDQAAPTGSFSWSQRPEVKLRRWFTADDCEYADAEHHAYARFSDPVIHRRRILFVKPRYWVIVDDLRGAQKHQFDLVFQFEPLRVQTRRGEWVSCAGEDGRGLALRAWSSASLHRQIKTGELDPPAGWISPDYGVRKPAARLQYSGEAIFPLRLVTLLLPTSSAAAELPQADYKEGCLQLDYDDDFHGESECVSITETSIVLAKPGHEKIVPANTAGG